MLNFNHYSQPSNHTKNLNHNSQPSKHTIKDMNHTTHLTKIYKHCIIAMQKIKDNH